MSPDTALSCDSRDPSSSSLVVKARPAVFSGGLFGLRCGASTVEGVFAQFPSVTKQNSAYDSTSPPKHGVTHTVPTTGPPVFARARRLFGEKLAVAQQEFKNCLLYTSDAADE